MRAVLWSVLWGIFVVLVLVVGVPVWFYAVLFFKRKD